MRKAAEKREVEKAAQKKRHEAELAAQEKQEKETLLHYKGIYNDNHDFLTNKNALYYDVDGSVHRKDGSVEFFDMNKPGKPLGASMNQIGAKAHSAVHSLDEDSYETVSESLTRESEVAAAQK